MIRRSVLVVATLSCCAAVISAQEKPKAMPVAVPRAEVMRVPAWTTPPRLVVGIVVDQMRPDYIYRYWDNFGDGGFKRLIGEGAFLRNAHYTYIPTITGPGHASIYTGSVPAHHGIVANERFDRETRKVIYCVKDTTVQGVGSATAQSSPWQLLATTLADEIERRTDRQGKTIGVALKDRSSVLPIGRTGDAAYWFSGNGFATSTWYMKELPGWVNDFNARKLPAEYLDRVWEPLLPIEKYHQALPDANPYELPIVPGGKSSFPYDLAELSKGPSGVGVIANTPWGNTLTTDMALAALAGEEMGKDKITDLIAISYSSTDILGHKMGPRSLEIEDMYIRLDQELARLLTELDKSVGAGKYTLFLTADHGVIDVPQYLKDLKGSAGYVSTAAWTAALRDSLRSQFDVASAFALDTILDGQVYFIEAGERMINVVGMTRKFLESRPEVDRVWGKPDLGWGGVEDDQRQLVFKGFMERRCGDILYTLKPGYFEAENAFVGKGTTHGSGWNYDTHVPVIMFGQGIVHGEVVRRTAVADIVPTVCMIVGCALPDAAVGEPVQEVIAR